MRFFMLSATCFAALSLAACQYDPDGSMVSRSQARELPQFKHLPLLRVKSVQSVSGGYHAELSNENGEKFHMKAMRDALNDNYVELSSGEKAKIIGDYLEVNDKKTRQLMIEIEPERIVLVR